MLLRGNELITRPHEGDAHIKSLMQRCLDLEASGEVVSADLMWGNPFTDVPELGCQVLLCMDSQEDKLQRLAEEMAAEFWAGREIMQAALIRPEVAVARACAMLGTPNPRNTRTGKGTVVLTDASDATSSGAAGNSNVLLRELVKQNYAGTVLFPIACPPSVAAAAKAGVGATVQVQLGGSLDKRYEPLPLDVVVEALSDAEGRTAHGGQFRQRSAVLRYRKITIEAFTCPPGFHTREAYEGHGHMPEAYDCVVIKTPHAQPEMFDEWCLRNFNTDCLGETSANVRTLGHKAARRPLYPLEGSARTVPAYRSDPKYEGHSRVLGVDFEWSPHVELYPMTP
eukprot:gnl/TRDRNA2_/TRDRNA2_135952_c1_seq1.p1 gnl/TRDRNA2_/TRDRNA2_135952_c1~~gnl/TRDRNA2_/TRDRNA2_135952_c1_seq1.p1  ORF type:complete len:340 (-),score=43.68 gnl/TRDRNA2_/TRDRNA2_135952_c1_seq1:1-1020(-)